MAPVHAGGPRDSPGDKPWQLTAAGVLARLSCWSVLSGVPSQGAAHEDLVSASPSPLP